MIVAGESKARFLASMSHEIRTPINTIVGMNEMILRENQNGIIQEYALNIKRESQLLLGLVNDVLDFSKIEAGKLKIVEKPYQPPFVMYDTVLAMMPRIREKNLELIREIDESVPKWLRGDEIRIRQVLNNLLSNAVKYTEQGRITFRVNGEWKNDRYWLDISVIDTGIGIRKEELPQVFDRFKRLELDKTHYIEGTGLGLNITKQLVESMGGTISVQSEYGTGSCFSVSLPQNPVTKQDEALIEKEKKRATQVTETDYQRFPGAKILAVDDNRMNLTVLTALLKRSEVKVETATGGTECIEKTKQVKYDLILMDHMMPDLDGMEAFRIIREDGENLNHETPVVVLTANALDGIEEKYLAEGFAGYLSKPISVERLESLLGELLSES